METEQINDLASMKNTDKQIENVRALVVDDSSLMRMAVKRIVSDHPGVVVVDTAVDGKDALDKIEANEYDIIFTDMEMPNVDGFELIKRSKWLTDASIVILSSLANTNNLEVQKALHFGADGAVAKPNGSLNARASEIYEYIDKLTSS